MARRRASKAPDLEAQGAAARLRGGRPWVAVTGMDEPLPLAGLYRERILPIFIEAARLAPHGPGAPPKWERLLAAAEAIHGSGEKLSDAPGSRCVTKVLIPFLEEWNRAHAVRSRVEDAEDLDSTAATLAGSLIAEIDAFEATMQVEQQWMRDDDGRWVPGPKSDGQ